MPDPIRFPLLLSILAAVATLALKGAAWALTGSVGLLSDALESFINLAAAVVAWLAVRYSARPADASHTYGHEKIEFFSSGLEGGLILAAAVGIGWMALDRLLHPRELPPLGLGLALSCIAAAINGLVAWVLLRAGKKHRSIVLEADGHHLLTDVWTSVGVVGGLAVAALTGRHWLDPVVALAVAALIVWTGLGLMRRSFDGLMDASLPAEDVDKLREAVRGCLSPGMDFHALRTRQAGSRRFADFHLLVPGEMTVASAHEVIDRIEAAVALALPGVELTVHPEPVEAEGSYRDSDLLAVEGAKPPGA
ncbi:MAG: cation diffusion facilitator family transporter [Gemmataceae bacterium]|nr:cation diffusion facilitator family transporter [Gemmataceae bacterium]